MADIRLLENEEEYKDAIQLCDHVFNREGMPSMGTAFPYIFSRGLDQSFGAFEDGKLVSFMGLVPAIVRIGSARLKVYSLGSVCTHSDYRGRGYASQILEKIQEHVKESGASILFVSGDRSLYRRIGCLPFGSFVSFKMDRSFLTKYRDSESFHVREQRQTDWFSLKQLVDERPVGFEQSLWDFAGLIKADGNVSRFSLKHRVWVAEKNGEIAGFAVIGEQGSGGSDGKPIAVEWGGNPNAVVGLFASVVDRHGVLEVPVPVFEDTLIRLLDSVEQHPRRNEGTVCIVNPGALIEQLRPFIAEEDEKIGKTISAVKLGDGQIEISAGEQKDVISLESFVSLVFDEKISNSDNESPLFTQLRNTVFPVPCPFVGGLNYV